MYFNIKNLISLILYIYNNLAANILVALIEKIIMMEKTMRITGSGMSNWNSHSLMHAPWGIKSIYLNELIHLANQ